MKTVWKKLDESKYEVYIDSSVTNNPIGYTHLKGKKWKIDTYFTLLPEVHFETHKEFDSWHEAGLHLTKLWRAGRAYSEFDFFDLDAYDQMF